MEVLIELAQEILTIIGFLAIIGLLIDDRRHSIGKYGR